MKFVMKIVVLMNMSAVTMIGCSRVSSDISTSSLQSASVTSGEDLSLLSQDPNKKYTCLDKPNSLIESNTQSDLTSSQEGEKNFCAEGGDEPSFAPMDYKLPGEENPPRPIIIENRMQIFGLTVFIMYRRDHDTQWNQVSIENGRHYRINMGPSRKGELMFYNPRQNKGYVTKAIFEGRNYFFNTVGSELSFEQSGIKTTFRVCNFTNNTIYSAYGYRYYDIWTASGWYRTEAKSCSDTLADKGRAKMASVYFYATTETNNPNADSWILGKPETQGSFCINTGDRFHYEDAVCSNSRDASLRLQKFGKIFVPDQTSDIEVPVHTTRIN